MNVQVVLLNDIEGVGPKDSLKTVPRGFARNYLLPLGFATIATPDEVELMRQRVEKSTKQSKSG